MLIVTLAVALGFLAGRAAGSGAPAKTAVRQVTTTQTVTSQVTAAPPTPSSGPFNQVIGTGNRCSMQKGNQLQLGVEVQNELDVPITLIGVHVPYATGDELRPIGSTRGACGQLPGADNSITGYPVAVGALVWVTVTIDVLTDCPAAAHLTIMINYSRNGQPATTLIGDFPDLGDVPYTGCR